MIYARIYRKLRMIYTITSGSILTVVLIIVFFLTEKQLQMGYYETFHNNVNTITSKLQLNNTITNTWMSSIEKDNNLVVSISDNGVPLLDHGTWLDTEERTYLFNQARNKAKQDGLDIQAAPVSYAGVRSNYYEAKGSNGRDYSAAVVMIPSGKNYRSAIILQSFDRTFRERLLEILFYCFVDIAGITALYIGSRILIGKTLRPVEESRKKQTEFIAAASHELKSPLAVIRTSATAVRKVPERAEDYISNIENESKRMARLIDDLLILSSTDAKSWTIKNGPMELDVVLINLYESYEPICRNGNITLEIELPEEVLPKINGDPERIKQILMILLDNALKHSKTKEKLILKAYSKRNYIYIEVIDFGVGISEEEKNLVFERFYRVDKSRMEKEHFGLGLSIARELVRLHGGLLTLKDTPGGGCTFVMKLPKLIEL